MSTELSWKEAAGRGVIYSFTVSRRHDPPVIALVDLEEGIRVATNIVGVSSEMLEVGMQVRVEWRPLHDGRNLPVFGLLGQGTMNANS